MRNATVTERIIAYILDIMLIFLLTSLLTQIRFLNPTYDKYSEIIIKYQEEIDKYGNKEITEDELLQFTNDNAYYLSKYGVSNNIITIVVIIGYFVFFQKYNQGQTLGKKIMKIKVVDNNSEENISIWRYILRYLLLSFVFIDGIIPYALNTIFVFILKPATYIQFSMNVSYVFLILNVFIFASLCFQKDKRGIHDIIARTKVMKES